MSHSLHISNNQIHLQQRQILLPVSRGENATDVCYPTCKIGYNLSYFTQDDKLLTEYLGDKKGDYLLPIIYLQPGETKKGMLDKIKQYCQYYYSSLNLDEIESLNDFSNLLKKQNKTMHIFVLDTHVLGYEQMLDVLGDIHNQIVKSDTIRATVIFEKNIQDTSISKVLETLNKFQQNISVFPTYSDEESMVFVQNLCREWEITIPKHTVVWLIEEFGGYLWFLREAVKQIRDNSPSLDELKILHSPSMRIRFSTLKHLLSKGKIRLMEGVANNKSLSKEQIESMEYKYLVEMGMIIQDGTTLRIRPKSMFMVGDDVHLQEAISIGRDGEVTFPDNAIPVVFSKQEASVLTMLVSNRGKIVNRENIARAMWGEDEWNEKYSDWAIDKLLSRIRNVILKSNIHSLKIITKKGRGFYIQ